MLEMLNRIGPFRAPILSRLYMFIDGGGGAGGGAPSGGSPAPSGSSGAPGTSPSPAPAAPAAGTPPPSTAAPSTGAPPATGQPPTTTPPTATLPSNEPNLDVLRASHRTLSELGDVETVRAATAVWNETRTLGLELNYTPESLQAAFKADPVGTLQTLRQESQQYRSSPQYAQDQQIQDAVSRAVQPLQNYVATQQAERYNAVIDTEFGKMFDGNDAFKARSVNGTTVPCPPELRGLVRDRFIETIKWNNNILKEVVQGKTSGLQRVFDEVVTDTLKAVTGYNTWGSPTTGAPTTGAPPTTGQPPVTGNRDARGRFVPTKDKPTPEGFNLDAIINGEAVADFLPSMRNFQQ